MQFTSKAIQDMEPIMDEQLMQWLGRASADWASDSTTAKPFDIGKRIQFLTVDIMTKICLGQPLGCVESDSDQYDFLQSIEQGNTVCQHLSVLLELNSLLHFIAKIPIIGARLVPQATDNSGVGRIMGVSLPADRDVLLS